MLAREEGKEKVSERGEKGMRHGVPAPKKVEKKGEQKKSFRKYLGKKRHPLFGMLEIHAWKKGKGW